MKRTRFRVAQLCYSSYGHSFAPAKGGLNGRPIPPGLQRSPHTLLQGAVTRSSLTLRRPSQSESLVPIRSYHRTNLFRFAQYTPRQITGQSLIYPVARTFHSSAPRQDVFFVAFPALKAHLLNLTRICLVVLPFVYRYKLWKKYPRTSLAFLNIPIFAVCIVIALALDQSPRTQRWRLLLMTGREELEWARKRFDDFLRSDGPLLLKEDDARVQQVQKVTQRIVRAIDEPDMEKKIVSAAHKIWPPPESTSPDVGINSEAEMSNRIRFEFPPSARATGSVAEMPFLPESSNPYKVFESTDWKLYIVDLPRINAFALPTREIVVYTGLINLLEDDTLLSAVLAHEISHVVQRHAVENAGFMNVATIAFDILRGISFAFTMSFPVVSDATASVFNVLNDYVAQRAYSRKLEEEADALGLEFMANAGYDPRGALDLWEVMALVEEDAAATGRPISIQDRMTLLRTHPTSIQRQKNLEKLLPRALELYRKSPHRIKKVKHENTPADSSSASSGDQSAVGMKGAATSAAPSTL